MDPLSLTGTLIAVLQITTAVISICYDYRQGVSSASKQIAQITDELNSLKDVLESLLGLIEKARSADASRLETVKLLAREGGPLENCMRELEALKMKLEVKEKGKWSKVGRVLVWPLKEKEVVKVLAGLERWKGVVGLGLSVDQMTLNLAIRDEVGELAGRFESLGNDQKRQEVYKWLAAPDPYANHIVNRKKRQPKTGLWIFKSKQYVHWLSSTNSFLWIYGIPGSGKTILCSTIIEQLSRYVRELPQTALAYFYFDFNDTSKRDIRSLMQSLITQFSAQHESLPLPVLQLYDSHQNGRKTVDTQELLSTLQNLILTFHNVYIVFDALDESLECDEVLEFINSLHNWGFSRLHLLVTSRPLHEIEESIGEIVSERVCMNDRVNHEDIFMYIGDKLENDKVLKKWPEDLRKLVRTKLLLGEQGMFQWVVCQLDLLRKCTSVAAIRKSLAAGLPRSLDLTYDQILLGIDETDRPAVMKVLMALTVCKMPLVLEEIAEILAVDLDIMPPRFDPDSRLLDPKTILSMCSSLISTSELSEWERLGYQKSQPVIRLAHASVADYLSLPSSSSSHPEFHFSRSDARQFLGRCFLGYLLNPVFATGHHVKLITKRKLEYPLLKHRAHFWPSYLHRKEGEPASYLDEKTIQTIQCFFETRNLPNGGNYAFWVGLLIPTSPLDTIKNTHPLYYAASFGLTDVVRIVLDTEKNLNIDALGGRARASALHVAVYRDHIDIARMLLERGANPSLANDLGEAPLFWARVNKNAEMAKLLREFGAAQLKGDWVWAMAEAEEDKVDFRGVGDADSSIIPKEYSVLFLEPLREA